jgi:aspartyl-tRNA synthetase
MPDCLFCKPCSAYNHRMLRTHTCGELRPDHIGTTVTLCGWVHRRRDHGGLIFVDLRDRYGITQVVVNPENKDVFAHAEKIRPEWVLKVTGVVRKRIAGAERDDNPTGQIEMEITALEVLNEAKTPPFEIADAEKTVNEELRLEYRYLDLRRERMQKNIITRHKMLQWIRTYFYSHDFIEVETPILIKGTPEGSREYLVPSRIYPGTFYVLPQSPQQLKQLTMVAGFDRYMQIARCFRDEDQRGDRQPEFTQVDVEMSFVTAEDVMQFTEGAFIGLTKELRPDVHMKTPFPRMTYEEAMNTYGSDKPDIRYELKFTDVSELCKGSGFGIFAKAVEAGGVVKCMAVPGGADMSRKEIDELTEVAKIYKAKGLAWIKVTQNGLEGVPVEKLGQELAQKIVDASGAKAGDIVLFAADTWSTACTALGAVRIEIAKRKNLADPKTFAYLWVTDFPMFEKDEETGDLAAVHHPFTRPNDASKATLKEDPLNAKAVAYDIVLNGSEVGGGSVRIHEPDLQATIFDLLHISKDDAERRFGHILKAFSYGAPPHGGIAWGVDRIIMLFCEEPNIREVIAYPKDQKAKDLMLGSPSAEEKKQLQELKIKIVE